MYKTLEALREAYETGRIPQDVPLVLGTDFLSVYIPRGPEDDPWADSECVFRMAPVTILEEALDMLGIPRDHV